jgi:hypothetical protein
MDVDMDVVMQGDDPALVRPGRSDAVVPLKRAVVLAVLLGAFVTLNVPFAGLYPLLGVVVGLAVFLVYRSPKGRAWLGLAGVACLGLAAMYIVTGQLRHDYRSDFDWPLQFTRAHVLGLLAVFLALAEAVRGVASQPPDSPLRPVPDTDRPTI